MRRREVVAGLIAGPALWSAAAWAQPAPQRARRIGVLMSAPDNDPEYVANLNAFQQRLEELGWSRGRNVQIDLRWGGGGQAQVHRGAVELVGLAPDVLIAPGSAAAGPALQATRSPYL